VYFATRTPTDDPVLQGAHWALAGILGDWFGPFLGPSLWTQITDLEVQQGGTWVPVA
jgi:hypothetical protein